VASAAAVAGAHQWRPSSKLADRYGKPLNLEQLLPVQLGQWRVDESLPAVLPSPDLERRLSTVYNQTLSRTYINPARDRVMLSVAYGGDQSDGTRAHRPESCYPAQGFAILSNRVDQLALVPQAHDIRVRRLTARAGSRWEPITYWVVVGDEIALSGTEQKLAQLRYGVRGLIPDGMLVRISNISRDSAESYRLHDDFARQAYASIEAGQLQRVFGGRRVL
jgi:EpsI family protein